MPQCAESFSELRWNPMGHDTLIRFGSDIGPWQIAWALAAGRRP